MGNKRPSFNLYVGDLLKDPCFLLCSWQAQNLWLRLLIHLHEMPRRGIFIQADGITPLNGEQIARLSNTPMADYMALSAELYSNNVASSIGGAMANRRMYYESQVNENKREAGKLGARARWHKHGKVIAGQESINMANDATSSSSSSSSSDSFHKNERESDGENHDGKIENDLPKFSPEQLAGEFNKIPGVKLIHFPRGGKLQPTIRAKTLARLKQYPDTAFWNDFFLKIQESKFLTGQVSSPGRDPFHVSFDWIMGPQNFDKIVSGTYITHEIIKPKERLPL